MKTISRYIMTLALLITAATGAWAQEESLLTTITATSEGSYSETTAGVVTVSHDNDYFDNTFGWLWYEHAGSVTVEAKDGYTITRCVFSQPYKTPFTVSTAPFKVDFIETSDPDMPEFKQYLCQGYMDGVSSIEVYGYAPAPATDPDAIDVTTNAASEQDLFTEASFNMPPFDATAEYELVRDMSVQMRAQVGDDATKEPRYRVQRNGESWVPADLEYEEVMALFSVNDLIENNTTLDPQNYLVSIYAVDDEGQPTGDAMNFKTFTFAPGRYCVTASALLDAPYEGTTAPSNIFELYQGYEVTVGAGEYATFYKDENLYTEDENAELYTISSVTESEAVLSDAITVAPANTPLLVYNKSQTETLTFLLIPTTDKTPDNVTAATQFVGTLEATTIPASTTGADNYALNGYAFVWVKNEIAVAANKCWLHIVSQPAAARAMTRSIVGGNGTTGIDAIENVTIDNEGWYDLQGRKLQAKPNRKGIYIHNGKKVIVR